MTAGHLDLLPTPTDEHQSVLAGLYKLFAAVRDRGRKVLFAPLRLHIADGTYREPDLLMVRDAADTRLSNRFWTGADLMVEMLSPDQPGARRGRKRRGYPGAEIVDPRTAEVTVLIYRDNTYQEYGTFGRKAQADSTLLPGLAIDIGALLNAAKA